MKSPSLVMLSPEELAVRFEALCIAQYESLERDEIAAYNRRYKKIQAIQDELKNRVGDQRRVLLKLLDHRNEQVRLTAAHAVLAIDYRKARAVFEDVAANYAGIQKLAAGMTLTNLDSGFYRPT